MISKERLDQIQPKGLQDLLREMVQHHKSFQKYWNSRNAAISLSKIQFAERFLGDVIDCFFYFDVKPRDKYEIWILLHKSYLFNLFCRCHIDKFYPLPRNSKEFLEKRYRLMILFQTLLRLNKWGSHPDSQIFQEVLDEHYAQLRKQLKRFC